MEFYKQKQADIDGTLDDIEHALPEVRGCLSCWYTGV